MKRCPVCKTAVFDDMDTCYGCMYRFGTKPEWETALSDSKAAAGKPVHASTGASPQMRCGARGEQGCLCREFLEKASSLIADLLADPIVEGEELVPFGGELAAMGAIADEQLDAQS